MVLIDEGTGPGNYAERLTIKFIEVVADILSRHDYQALYEFGNQVNGLAARRGLPHEEPVALLDLETLMPEDFKKGGLR